jgi:hypothetical protein
VERVRSDLERYKELLRRYRDATSTLRQAESDNQYLVQAVQEREQWISECRSRNDDLLTANSDLLERYEQEARRKLDPVFGLGRVALENEVQDYRFKLEDLQVTEFISSRDIEPHVRDAQGVAVTEQDAVN